MQKLSKLNAESSMNDSISRENEKKNANAIKGISDSGREIIKIIKEEDEEIGSVKMGVYLDYSRYMGGTLFLLMIAFIMSMWQANKGGSDLWLAYWSLPENQEESQNDQKSKWIFFGVYCALNFSSVFFIFLRIYLLTVGIIRLGRYLHKDMIIKLVRAPINLFHETIPRGQIFNRLSKDLDALNFSIFSVGDTLVCFLSCVGSFVLCAIYDLYSIIYMPFVLIVGYFITRFYLKGSRPLTRLEAISRSPILNTISETIPGYASIRAFGKEEVYCKKFYQKINDCFNINICIRGINMWLQEMFKFLSIFYLIYLVTKTCFNEETATAQSVGITFTYSVVLQDNLGWAFSIAANLENIMISLERCLQYTRIKSEKPSEIKPKDEELEKKNWPQEGRIRFENYSVRYRPTTEVVLKNLNFQIEGNEKVGVVGRTGSGKSTICLCLFRILEPLEGTIYIDDEDITKMGLDILRRNMTIIPQDPCLMEGSLKYNIDPFETAQDDEIIQILKKIGFEYTESDDKILNRKIEQGGSNLSVGEKQLVCIARAILRKTKIIVMDEATANIDMKTEEKIQNALEYVLNFSTVITVAHRIKTIINYDKILVLNNGKIEEFDTPKNLLKNEKSLFYELYSKSTM
jgi:ATP-binding cassette subfamily C (CFTR/MRP) protein 1